MAGALREVGEHDEVAERRAGKSGVAARSFEADEIVIHGGEAAFSADAPVVVDQHVAGEQG